MASSGASRNRCVADCAQPRTTRRSCRAVFESGNADATGRPAVRHGSEVARHRGGLHRVYVGPGTAQACSAATSVSNGSPTHRRRLFTSRTGANISNPGHGNGEPPFNAASTPAPARSRSSISRAGAHSAIRTAAASHSRQPLTTCPTRARRPADPSATSRVTRSPQSGLSRVADPCGAASRPRPLARRAAAMIASW